MYLKDLNAAIEDYQDAIKKLPRTHMGSYMGLAQSYIISRAVRKKPWRHSRQRSTAIPDNHLVYNNRGLFLQQQGKSQEAMNDFNKAIELDKNFATAYTNRGYTIQGLGKLARPPKRISQKRSAIEPGKSVCSRAFAELAVVSREIPPERSKTTPKRFA